MVKTFYACYLMASRMCHDENSDYRKMVHNVRKQTKFQSGSTKKRVPRVLRHEKSAYNFPDIEFVPACTCLFVSTSKNSYSISGFKSRIDQRPPLRLYGLCEVLLQRVRNIQFMCLKMTIQRGFINEYFAHVLLPLVDKRWRLKIVDWL